MNSKQIEAIQEKIGAEPDGFWGPQSILACKTYLKTLMPKPNPWPQSDRASVEAFFGKPGDERNLVSFDFPFPMFYEGKKLLKSRCHYLVRDSLLRVLKSLEPLLSTTADGIEAATDYGGIYNFRPKRGGTSMSLHSWGIAIDLDADDNGFRDAWPVKADMPFSIMEAFAREGWTAAGAFWGYDAMHFQATRP